MRKLVYILAFVLLLAGLKSVAQQEVYKVSKLIDRDFTQEVKEVEIIGEKATIEIEGWNKNYIDVQIRMISRNPMRKNAEIDLQYIKTDLIQTGSTLRMKNFFEGKSSQITSNLSVEYIIKVPSTVSLTVSNLYGKLMVRNSSNQIQLDVSFGSIELESVNGKINVLSKYGDITGDKIEGSISCTAEKTDINLKEVNAPVKIKSKYGEIALSLTSNQYPVIINSHRTKLLLTIPDKPFNYKLKTLFSEIDLPDKTVIKDDFYEKKINDTVSTLELSTSYCPIIILTGKKL